MGKNVRLSDAEKDFSKYYLTLPWFGKMHPEDIRQYEKASNDALSGKSGFWNMLLAFINCSLFGY
jgi:hypothetical protein